MESLLRSADVNPPTQVDPPPLPEFLLPTHALRSTRAKEVCVWCAMFATCARDVRDVCDVSLTPVR